MIQRLFLVAMLVMMSAVQAVSQLRDIASITTSPDPCMSRFSWGAWPHDMIGVIYSAPVLLEPQDNAEVPAQGRLVFRWSPVASRPGVSIRYQVSIVEVRPGQQPVHAFRTNHPLLERTVSGVTELVCPPDVQLAGVGRRSDRFVWSVRAFDDGGNPVERSGFFAEPFTFRVRESVSGAESSMKAHHHHMAFDAPDSGAAAAVQTLAQTHGVNYQLKSLMEHPDFISSSTVSFEVQAEIMGQTVNMICSPPAVAAGSACCGPCNYVHHIPANCTLGPLEEDSTQAAKCALAILRFSQYGRVESPIAFDWMVIMADDAALLSGSMSTRRGPDGALIYPANAQLGGRMIVFVKLDGAQAPVRLTSRKTPEFTGSMPGWPPFGLTLTLANAPIDYYLEADIDNPVALPYMTVTGNSVTLGGANTSFFALKPKILTAARMVNGVAITWQPTAGAVATPVITQYNIYRTWDSTQLGAWTHIATVPANTTSYVDAGNLGDKVAQYVVSHAAAYPFGFIYEGIFDQPTTVAAVR